MNNSAHDSCICNRRSAGLIAVVTLIGATGCLSRSHRADGEDVLSRLRSIPASTLSDAVDTVVGARGFMSHDMRPVSLPQGQRLAGRARTLLLGPISENPDKKDLGLKYGVEILDSSGPGEVFVASTGSLDITGFGGLMSRTAKLRGIEGAIIDGAVRDVEEMNDLGFTAFSRSVAPSTIVGRWTSIARDTPIECGGITVRPGDYLVGDRDGVVRIPSEHVEAVIERALEFEAKEKKMIPLLNQSKSLQQAINEYNRI